VIRFRDAPRGHLLIPNDPAFEIAAQVSSAIRHSLVGSLASASVECRRKIGDNASGSPMRVNIEIAAVLSRRDANPIIRNVRH
jgi:hypothetical protein